MSSLDVVALFSVHLGNTHRIPNGLGARLLNYRQPNVEAQQVLPDKGKEP